MALIYHPGLDVTQEVSDRKARVLAKSGWVDKADYLKKKRRKTKPPEQPTQDASPKPEEK